MTTNPEPKTARGISTQDLDRLDAARKVLLVFEDEIVAAMNESGDIHPLDTLQAVTNVRHALNVLINEPVL